MAESDSFPGVNLGPLQFIGVVYINRLPLCIKIHRAQPAFAMAVSRGLSAAKGLVTFRPDGGGIHIRDTGIEVAHGAKRLVDVASVDGR